MPAFYCDVGLIPFRNALEPMGTRSNSARRGCGFGAVSFEASFCLRRIPPSTRLRSRLSSAAGAFLLAVRRAGRGLHPLPWNLSWRSGRPRIANLSASCFPASDCRCRSEHFGLAYRSCRPARQLDDGSIRFWTDSRSNCSAAGVFLNARAVLRSACRCLPRTHCCGLLRPLRSRV